MKARLFIMSPIKSYPRKDWYDDLLSVKTESAPNLIKYLENRTEHLEQVVEQLEIIDLPIDFIQSLKRYDSFTWSMFVPNGIEGKEFLENCDYDYELIFISKRYSNHKGVQIIELNVIITHNDFYFGHIELSKKYENR